MNVGPWKVNNNKQPVEESEIWRGEEQGAFSALFIFSSCGFAMSMILIREYHGNRDYGDKTLRETPFV